MNNYELVGFFNPFGDDIPDFVWPVFKKDSDENLYLQDELLCLENIKFTKLNESLVNKVKFLNNYNISDYNGIDNYSKLKEYNFDKQYIIGFLIDSRTIFLGNINDTIKMLKNFENKYSFTNDYDKYLKYEISQFYNEMEYDQKNKIYHLKR